MRNSVPGLVLAASLAALLTPVALQTAAAADSWQVDRVAGQAWVTTTDGQKAELSAGMALPPGATLSTGARARVMLVRGAETMMVGPKSVVAVSEHPTEGLTTTVLEKAGEVQFDVEKRNVHYFSVETPMLAAVVKGTHFTVSVGRTNGGVKVARGTVEVTALATGQVSDVTAGQHAHVNSRGMSVGGIGHPSVSIGQPRAAVVSALTAPAPTVAPTAQFTQAELAAVATVSTPAAVASFAAVASPAAASPANTGSTADHTSSAVSTPPATVPSGVAITSSTVSASVGSALSALSNALAGPAAPTARGGPAASAGKVGPAAFAPGLPAARPGMVGPAAAPLARAPAPPAPPAPAPAPAPAAPVGPAAPPAPSAAPGIASAPNAHPGNAFGVSLAGLARGLVGLATGVVGQVGQPGHVGPGAGVGSFGRGR